MHLELTDEQTEALIRELSLIIDGDRSALPHAAAAALGLPSNVHSYDASNSAGETFSDSDNIDLDRITVAAHLVNGRGGWSETSTPQTQSHR